MSDKDPRKNAVTRLAHDGKPDHTTYSYDGLRRSFDSDKGLNPRNDHFAENGPSKFRGPSVNRPEIPKP